MKRTLLILAIIPSLLVSGCANRQARLETGGAYAIEGVEADLTFYQIDAAYRVAEGTIDAAFKFESDNREMLWAISPEIKKTLDSIRPEAVAAKQRYLNSRATYKAMPVPANLPTLQAALIKMQQLEATASIALPK